MQQMIIRKFSKIKHSGIWHKAIHLHYLLSANNLHKQNVPILCRRYTQLNSASAHPNLPCQHLTHLLSTTSCAILTSKLSVFSSCPFECTRCTFSVGQSNSSSSRDGAAVLPDTIAEAE